MSIERPTLVLERTVAAPIDAVWKMWTEPEEFSEWYGPDSVTIPLAEMDATVGGKRFLRMEAPTQTGKQQMWVAGEFLEVEAPERLVYTEAVADEEGNIKEASELGLPTDVLVSTEVTVQLAVLPAGTSITVRHVGIPQDSAGMTGWNMALDKLEKRLEPQD